MHSQSRNLKNKNKILKSILKRTGSQCKEAKTEEILSTCAEVADEKTEPG